MIFEKRCTIENLGSLFSNRKIYIPYNEDSTRRNYNYEMVDNRVCSIGIYTSSTINDCDGYNCGNCK